MNTHYEFIQTRTSYDTHVRASLREDVLSDAWISQQLRIMNLSRHARPMRRTTYETHVRASLREGVLSYAWNSQQLRIMNYEL